MIALAAQALSLALLAAAPSAQAARPAASAPDTPTPVDPLTVAVPKNPPHLVSSYPGAGATVAPGTVVLKVTFDQAMAAETWGFAKADGDYPDCLPRPRLLHDGKTFVLLCSTLPGHRYSIALNAASPAPGDSAGFTSVGRRAADPATLAFTTTTGDPVRTLKDAMTAAGLHDDDSPVEGPPIPAAARKDD